MKIQQNSYVAIDYTLTDQAGEELDKSNPGQPLGFVFGANMIIPGLEAQIEGLEAGETKEVVVPAKDAYGEVREDLFRDIPRDQFPPDADIQPGMSFAAETPRGVARITVSEVKGDTIVVDLNHPLAGTELHFDVSVSEVREATPDDLMPDSCCDDTSGCNTCSGC